MFKKAIKQSPTFQKFIIKSAKIIIGLEVVSFAAGAAFYHQYNNNPGDFFCDLFCCCCDQQV